MLQSPAQVALAFFYGEVLENYYLLFFHWEFVLVWYVIDNVA